MKKYPLINKIMSLCLVAAIFASLPINVYATAVDGSMAETTTIEENSSEVSNSNSGENSDTQSSEDSTVEESTDASQDETDTSIEDSEENPEGKESDSKDSSNSEKAEEELAEEEKVEEESEDEDDEVIVLTDSNGIVTITGEESVLNGAVKVTADEITAESDSNTYNEMSDALEEHNDDTTSVVDFVAYDINLYDEDGTVVEPTGEVKVEFNNLDVERVDDECSTEVYHYEDNFAKKMDKVTANDDTVEMTTDHFSTYIIAIKYSIDADKALIKDSEYLTILSSEDVTIRDSSEIGENHGYNDNSKLLTINIFVDGENCAQSYLERFILNADSTELTMSVKEGYTLSAVRGNYIYTKVNNSGKFSKPSKYEIKSTSNQSINEFGYGALYNCDDGIKVKTNLEAVGNVYNPIRNYINVYLLSTSNDTILVPNAKFVDYNSGAFNAAKGGNSGYFRFNAGNGANGDYCHYGQVYQGLASNTLSDGKFILNSSAVGKQNYDLFPDFDSAKLDGYPYNSLAYDASVEFVKDNDGYYTLDSTQYGYDLVGRGNYGTKAKGAVLRHKTEKESNGMWPFETGSAHYAMMIPIVFTINEDGKINGKDTVFQFMGDDDVYVYIDGKLVLDLGGIHDKVNGSINFKDGSVNISGENNEYKDYTSDNGLVYSNKSLGNKNIYEILDEKDCFKFAQKEHTMTVVYFERGGYVSNCRIKYNFATVKTSTTTDVSFKKTDDNNKPIQGADFTLYKDEECNSVVEKRTSDENGIVKYENVEIGTYYIKETKAADGYSLPEDAIWKLDVEKIKGRYSTTLTAVGDEATKLLVDDSDSTTTTKKIIKNVQRLQILKLTKIVSDGTSNDPDPGALYSFKLERILETDADGKITKTEPVTSTEKGFSCTWTQDNQTVSGTVATSEDGTFLVYNTEEVTINDLPVGKYRLTENGITGSNHNYTLSDYETRVVINDSTENAKTFEHDTDERSVLVDLTAADESNVTTVKYENLKYTESVAEITGTNRKYISNVNEDGTYDLTLDFTAPYVNKKITRTVPMDSSIENPKYDILVVFDTSSSVDTNELVSAKNAINSMADIAVKNNSDIQWKLIEFNNFATTKSNSWQDSSNFKNTVNALESNEYVVRGKATNYQDALELANTEIKTCRSDAKSVILFITDGIPTVYNGKDGQNNKIKVGLGSNISDDTYNNTITAAKRVTCDYFYGIGVGLDDSSLYRDVTYVEGWNIWGYYYYVTDPGFSKDITPEKLLNNVASATTSGNAKVYTCDSFSSVANELTKVIEGISTAYTKEVIPEKNIYSTQAVIEDVLSEYVEFAEENVSYSYKVLDSNNNEVQVSFSSIEKYEADKRKLTVTITNKDGLADYKYSVTFKIKPTEKAYESFIENGNSYLENMIGESNTGDSSDGKHGFYSNDWAKVKFTTGDKESSLDYNKPVIQINTVYDWKIVKKSATEGKALAGAEFNLVVPSAQGASTIYYGLSDSNGEVLWYESINDRDYMINPITVPDGTYTLVETKAPEGYAKSTDKWTVTINRKNGISVIGSTGEVTPTMSKSESNGITLNTATFVFENTVAYTLPETGGRGIYVYTIGGVLLMIGASLMLYKNKKNKINN
ncbi:MAG: VWA domain-containing protein [Pseudobutyrivibrio sp.]|nr:VWA domain-containing protein [Pseudobutyrivibrio sp.]